MSLVVAKGRVQILLDRQTLGYSAEQPTTSKAARSKMLAWTSLLSSSVPTQLSTEPGLAVVSGSQSLLAGAPSLFHRGQEPKFQRLVCPCSLLQLFEWLEDVDSSCRLPTKSSHTKQIAHVAVSLVVACVIAFIFGPEVF